MNYSIFAMVKNTIVRGEVPLARSASKNIVYVIDFSKVVSDHGSRKTKPLMWDLFVIFNGTSIVVQECACFGWMVGIVRKEGKQARRAGKVPWVDSNLDYELMYRL